MLTLISRVVLLIALLGIWFLVRPEPGYAHQCILDPDKGTRDYWIEFNAVFVGTIVETRRQPYRDLADTTYISVHKVSVEALYKGDKYSTIYVTSGWGFSISPPLSLGETYIFFANPPKYVIGTGLNGECNPTDHVDGKDGREHLRVLNHIFDDNPEKPVPGTTLPTPTFVPTLTPEELDPYYETPTPVPTSTLAPTTTPTPTPTKTPDPVASTPGRTLTPPAAAPEHPVSSGCGRSTAAEISVAGIMIGIVGLAVRRKRHG